MTKSPKGNNNNNFDSQTLRYLKTSSEIEPRHCLLQVVAGSVFYKPCAPTSFPKPPPCDVPRTGAKGIYKITHTLHGTAIYAYIGVVWGVIDLYIDPLKQGPWKWNSSAPGRFFPLQCYKGVLVSFHDCWREGIHII